MTARFHRNTREAFPSERAPALFGPYKRNPLQKWGNALLWLFSVGMLLVLVFAPAIWRAV